MPIRCQSWRGLQNGPLSIRFGSQLGDQDERGPTFGLPRTPDVTTAFALFGSWPTSRNTRGQQIPSVLPLKGGLSETSQICRDRPVPDSCVAAKTLIRSHDRRVRASYLEW